MIRTDRPEATNRRTIERPTSPVPPVARTLGDTALTGAEAASGLTREAALCRDPVFLPPKLKHDQREQAFGFSPTLGLPVQQLTHCLLIKHVAIRFQQDTAKELQPPTGPQPT